MVGWVMSARRESGIQGGGWFAPGCRTCIEAVRCAGNKIQDVRSVHKVLAVRRVAALRRSRRYFAIAGPLPPPAEPLAAGENASVVVVPRVDDIACAAPGRAADARRAVAGLTEADGGACLTAPVLFAAVAARLLPPVRPLLPLPGLLT